MDNPEFSVEPKYLTAEQCAVRFAISLRHFKYLVASGEMPRPIHFGKSAREARTRHKVDAPVCALIDGFCKEGVIPDASRCVKNNATFFSFTA